MTTWVWGRPNSVNLLSTWAALLRKVHESHWLGFENFLHLVYPLIIWCNASWFRPNYVDDNQTTFSKAFFLDVWLFLIIHFSLKIPISYLSMALHFFLEESQHVHDDLKSLVCTISCHMLHQYRQNQCVHQMGFDSADHPRLVSHWHYLLWAVQLVFARF